MSKHNKTLTMNASKLGLGEEDKVINKAAELERLLQTKTTAGSNMTDTSKTVICLDLAAGIFGADLDMKTAIKYSGLKPAMYTNNRKVVQNLLELNEDKLTTLVLCSALHCSNVLELADKIIKEFQKQAKMEVDLDLPQYVCMAVHQACRVSKVKITKSKIIEKSRLKPTQWTKLEADWTKLVDEKFAMIKKKKGRQAKSAIQDEVEDRMEVDASSKPDEIADPQPEPYHDWKKRVLDAAYKDLKKLKDEQVQLALSPRRSPRKTPQKKSPLKSPVKHIKKGVRLLFPLNLM